MFANGRQTCPSCIIATRATTHATTHVFIKVAAFPVFKDYLLSKMLYGHFKSNVALATMVFASQMCKFVVNVICPIMHAVFHRNASANRVVKKTNKNQLFVVSALWLRLGMMRLHVENAKSICTLNVRSIVFVFPVIRRTSRGSSCAAYVASVCNDALHLNAHAVTGPAIKLA